MILLREFIRKLLDQEHAETSPWEVIFQKIRDNRLHGHELPNIDYNKLSDLMNKDEGYDMDKSAFVPVEYADFEDWFLRNMTPSTMKSCLIKSQLADMCSPVQGTVRKKVPAGAMTLKKSVIDVNKLLGLLNCDQLIQVSLQKTDYHYVHCPVDGVIKEVTQLEKDVLFPGSESMTIISIQSEHGIVKVLSIGEWTVQTFVTQVSPGDYVLKLDKLGYFYFGSQVIVAFPKGYHSILNQEGKERVFPGDPMCLIGR